LATASRSPAPTPASAIRPSASRRASVRRRWPFGGGNGGRGRSDSYRSRGPDGGGFAGFADIRSEPFGGASHGSKTGSSARVGRNLKLIFTVDFLAAVNGAKRRIGLA